MVKRLIGALVLALVGGLLAACGAATQTSNDAASGGETTVSGASSPMLSIDSDLYGVQDLSLIANTDKPQFIHSFADW